MGRILEILDEHPPSTTGALAASADITGGVEFRHLTFGYGNGTPVLKDIHLVVRAGADRGDRGPDGLGQDDPREPPPAPLRSAAGNAVRRRHRREGDPPPGAAAEQSASCPRRPFLFSDTLRDEPRLRPGRRRRQEQVEWASGVAQLAKDVAVFPEGYETAVGERGLTLSGGQKQRATLARALASTRGSSFSTILSRPWTPRQRRTSSTGSARSSDRGRRSSCPIASPP